MFDRICLYESKVFVPFINERDAFLVAYKHNNDTIKQHFKELFRIKIPLKCLFEPKKILLDVVDCYLFGIKCIVVVAINHSNDLQIFFYCNTTRSSLFEVLYLSHSSKVDIPICNVYLTHGPTLLTFLNETIDIFLLSQSTKTTLNLQSIFPAKDVKILQFTCVGQILKECPIYIMLLILSGKTLAETKQNISIFALGINVTQDNMPVICEELSLILFFPKFLKNCIQTLEVSNLFISQQNVSEISDINWKTNHSVLCTKRECFVYLEGELKFVTNLPLEDIAFIKLDALPSLEYCNLILSSSQKVCLLKHKKDSNELELKKSWLDIQSLLIGDILINSSKQMMLIKNSCFESWHKEYIITDISNFIPVDIQDHSAILGDCLSATLSGLHAKYQAGKSAVAQKELEIREKMEATMDALNRLSDTACEGTKSCDISSFQDSLVDLILIKDENCKMEMDKRGNKQMLKILNHFTKLINNQWFLCWTFMNEGESELCNPILKIIIQDQPIQCLQKIFLHSTNDFSLEDKCIKQIDSQQMFSIITAIKHPEFFSDNITTNVILTWLAGSSNEFENELFLPLEEKCLTQNQIPLLFGDLKMNDIFTDIDQDLSLAQDFLCMSVLHQKCIFKVSSLHSDLSTIEKILLTSELGAQQLTLVIKNPTSKTLFLKNKTSCLYGAHFIFKYMDSKSSVIEVFAKTDKELLLLIQFLKQCLPKDVILIPYCKTDDEMMEMKQKLICAMKEEVDLLTSAFNVHNIAAQIQDYSDLPIQAGTIVIPKRTFLRVRRALVKKESITDNIVRNICSSQE